VYHIIHGWAAGRIFTPATKKAYIKRFMLVMKLKAKVYDFKIKKNKKSKKIKNVTFSSINPT
jgi:hypothetical protein